MNAGIKDYISLMIWVIVIIVIGMLVGSLTKEEVDVWYDTLNRSSLTPPNYVFPIVWTILYMMIGISGWMIWREQRIKELKFIKSLYVVQLILNWSWTPLFFGYQLAGYSLICLLMMDIIVGMIIYFSYRKIRGVALLMTPYLVWILFATYLNLYIWQHNYAKFHF